MIFDHFLYSNILILDYLILLKMAKEESAVDITELVEKIYYDPQEGSDEYYGCRKYHQIDVLVKNIAVYTEAEGPEHRGRLENIKRSEDSIDVHVHIALSEHGIYLKGKVIEKDDKIYIALLDIANIAVEKPKTE